MSGKNECEKLVQKLVQNHKLELSPHFYSILLAPVIHHVPVDSGLCIAFPTLEKIFFLTFMFSTFVSVENVNAGPLQNHIHYS